MMKSKKSQDFETEENFNDLLHMDEAIEFLKTTRPTFYRWLRSGKVIGNKIGRQWRFLKKDLIQFLKGESPEIELKVNPEKELNQLEKLLKKQKDPQNLEGDWENGPIPRLVGLMIRLALAQNTSDIHLEPSKEGGDWVFLLRHRIDGVLHEILKGDFRLFQPLIEKWKTLADLNPRETNLPQDGRILLKYGVIPMDFRVSVVPAFNGESLVVRILQKPGLPTLDKFGFSPENLKKFRKLIHSSHGMILVNGPTGSGKTSTLTSVLSEIGRPAIKMISIEDPVEIVIPHVTQFPVRNSLGLTIPALIRSALRQDLDVLMVSEIRDPESLNLLFKAAMTGHLVFSCFHCPSSAHALKIMIQLGVEPFLIGDNVLGLLSQRLVRRLCKTCAIPHELDPQDKLTLERLNKKSGIKLNLKNLIFKKAVGCQECSGMGYKGRFPISELLTLSPGICQMLKDGKSTQELEDQAVQEGMVTLAAEALQRASIGETSLEELWRVKSIGMI